MLIKVTCDRCKQEIWIPFYFSNFKITTESYCSTGSVDYYARTTGTGICYCCGAQISKHFNSIITNDDIIALATYKEDKRPLD